MAELKGTRTEANLQTAFAGESMARNKYTFFASKAKKDGYVQIAKIFEETAANEKEHAKIWFKLLNGGIDDTAANLKAAAEGENYEWTDMPPSPKRRVRRASTISRICLRWSARSKRSTRNATAGCSGMSRISWSFPATATAYGSAPTADISWLAGRRPRSARSARILKPTLNSRLKISKGDAVPLRYPNGSQGNRWGYPPHLCTAKAVRDTRPEAVVKKAGRAGLF